MAQPPQDREHVVITFAPMRHAVPVVVRVRRLLKFALRGCGLRCVSVDQLPTGTMGQGPAPDPDPRSPPR
jgi:hypothetical protein